MKIKCKKCGKHFDAEMYSGLCPKCGTYNSVRREETDVSRYLNSGYSQKDAHEKLHEMYGDTGHEGDAHEKLHEMYGDTGHEGDAHQKLHEEYDGSCQEAHPTYAQQGEAKKSRSQALAVVCVFLIFLIVLVPALCAFSLQAWKENTAREALGYEVRQLKAADGNAIVLEGGALEYPIHVTLLEAGEAFVETLQEGKMLVEVKASIVSEDYNFGTALEVALGYRAGENTFYRRPLEQYALKDYLALLGIAEEDLLSTYNPGNGNEANGYYYFIVDDDAEDLQLFLSVRENRDLQRVFLEGEIALESVWGAETKEEAE